MSIEAVALTGLQQAGKQLETAARQLSALPSLAVAAGEDSVDLSSAMVQLMSARRTAEANIAVLRAGDEMSRKLLDILA